jgi:hypothetical protein
MRFKTAMTGVIPLIALAVWAPGCESSGHDAPNQAHDVAPEEATIDEDAVEIVRGAAHLLREAGSFSIVMDTGFDVVQSDGQKLEFGAHRKAVITRPDHARFETERRDGKHAVVVLDGTDLWVFSPTHNVYAQTPQPGDIDASVDYITEELGITSPMSDLFASDVGSSLADGLESCYLVGQATIGGVVCGHVAVRNDYADYQMWVAIGDQPILKRIVITYREEPGQPQFWANFTEWNMEPDIDSTTFAFQPPDGAERINFVDLRPDEEE